MSGVRQFRWGTHTAWAALGIGAAASIIALWMPISRDAGGFLTIGTRIADGEVFYRDIFERKTPLLLYMVAAVFKIVGPQLLAARLFMLLHAAIAALLVRSVVRRLAWPAHVQIGVVGAFLLFNVAYLGFEVMTEVPVMLAGTIIMWLLVGRSGSISGCRWFGVGLLIGIAASSKQVGILYAPAVGVWLLVGGSRAGGLRTTLVRALPLLALGTVVPLALWAGYFALIGSFDEMVFAVWTANVAHYPGPGFEVWLLDLVRGTLLRGLPLWVAVGVWFSVILRRYLRRGEAKDEALLLLIIGFSFLPSLKRPYDHYVISYLPHLTILAFMIWREWWGQYRRLYVVIAALAFSVAPVRHYALYLPPRLLHAHLQTQKTIAHRITSHLKPDETFYVLGSEPKYWFLARRSFPDPLVFILPENAHMMPTEELRRLVFESPGLRYVLVVEGVLDPVRQVVDEVRQRGDRVFAVRVDQTETAELYRLPDAAR